MTIRQIVTNEAYLHLSDDVRAAILYVNEVTSSDDPLLNIRDRLFRAGLRVMRAERELAALSQHIGVLADAHGIESNGS